MTTKHTPTPWKADYRDVCQVRENTIHVIANVKDWREVDEVDLINYQDTTYGAKMFVEINHPIDGGREANAAHIVKCVNMHDELVSALKRLQRATKEIIENNDVNVGIGYPVIMKGVSELIAKAEGK